MNRHGRKFRCRECGHAPRRVVSVTTKTAGKGVVEAKQHKRPCGCRCHAAGEVSL